MNSPQAALHTTQVTPAGISPVRPLIGAAETADLVGRALAVFGGAPVHPLAPHAEGGGLHLPAHQGPDLGSKDAAALRELRKKAAPGGAAAARPDG